MSQIINPERRDPSFSRLKADVGLSKVNNVSLSEILVLAKDQIKEEVNRGDVYATQELSSSNRKPIYIPLCRFKDNSSWANIIIGLIDSSSNVLSFVEIKVIHTKDIGLNLSISAAPENSLWGIIKFHLAKNGNKDELYLSLPYNSYSKYKISGVTINVKDYLISTSGSSVSSNIEILSHSSIIDSLTSKQTIDLKSLNRRDISSSTESLAVYKDNEPYFPSSSEDLNKGNYDLPRINGVPFTGDKDLKYGGKSTRDITITAQHSGKSVGEAGIHDWEVLEGIPVVGYKNTGESEESKDNSTNTSTTPKPNTTPLPGITEGTSTPQPLSLEDVEESETKTEGRATTVTYTYGTDALGKGLCRLVDIPELPEISGSSIQNIANLRGLVNEVSSLNDEHVVSIGFLRKYTELLLRVVESGVSSSENNDFWFFKGNLTSDSTEEEINNSKKIGLSLLTVSPIAGKYARYQFCSLFDTSIINPTKVYLSLPKDSPYVLRKIGTQEDLNKTDEIIELGPSKVINNETSEVKNYSNVYTFDICSKEDVFINETSFGKPVDLQVLYGESIVGKIRISSDVFSSAKESCIFKDGTNGEYKLPVVFTRAGYFNEDANSEKKFNEFRNYVSDSEFLTCTKKTNSTTGGLIWKSFNSSKYEIGCNLPPKNDWFKKTKKSLLLEFFSISSNLTITNKTQGSITIYNSGFRGVATIGPNGSTSIETEVGEYAEYTEDLFDYRNILKNNYSSNSSSYKYYLKFDISSNKDNLNIEEAVNLGSIIFSSSSEYATLNVYQRPDILRWAMNTNLYKLFSPYGSLDWSTEIPVNLNYENTKLSPSIIDNLNFISKLDTQDDGYLVLSDSKSGNLILSGSGKEDLVENKTVTYSLENQDVYWNSIGNKYYPLEFIPENDSTHSSKISGYEYVGDTVITSIIPDLPTTSATYNISTNLSDMSGSLRKAVVVLSTGNNTPWTKYTPEFEFTFVRKSSDGFASEYCSTECYVSKEASNSKVKATLIKREDGIETWNWKESTAITLPSYTSTEGLPSGIVPYSKLVRTIRFEQTEFDQPQYYDTFGDNTITYEITFIFTTKYSVITDSNSGLINSRPGLTIDNNTDLIL